MNSVKRVWNKLFGRAVTDASFAEKQQDTAATQRQQVERRRLQDEMSLRATRNGLNGGGGFGF